MPARSVTFDKKTLVRSLAVLTFGLSALAAVLELEFLVAPIFVVGFFVLVPLVAILGESLPMVEEAVDGMRVESGTDDALGDDPVDRLRQRYARGEITDAEFERRLERLLETENLDAAESRERAFDRE